VSGQDLSLASSTTTSREGIRLRPAAPRIVLTTVAAALLAFAATLLYGQPVHRSVGSPAAAGTPAAGRIPAAAGSPAAPAQPQWVGTWAASMSDGPVRADVAGDAPTYTVRNIVRISVGGDALRLRLSNVFGAGAAMFGPVTVALADPDAAKGLAGDATAVTFGGATAVGVAAGGAVVSDPVPLVTDDGATLVVSIHVPVPPPRVSRHVLALRDTYIAEGEHAADASGDAFDRRATSWFFLAGIDVAGSGARGAVLTFGDSITDGHGSTFGADRRWPDVLAARLERSTGGRLAVVNAGISGNRLLDTDDPRLESGTTAGPRPRGRSGVARADRDIAEPAGTRTMVLMLGINDIRADATPTVAEVWSGYERIVATARARGIRVLGATLLPFGGSGRFTAAREAVRSQVNERIRAGELFDGFVDADAAVRDPDDPARMRRKFQKDWLHPNDAGHRAIAEAVDLSIL
jgi:lysophospholipase L1-like esterase